MGSPIICLMGPTAAGKTDAALSLVDKFDMEIISVDSAMIYRSMDIGTAKPEEPILKKYPHHLVDIREPSESYSASDFKQDAEKCIEAILARGKQPLLVGGTMLYFKALQEGLSQLPEANDEVRRTLMKEAVEKGWAALYDELKQIDPESAERIHPNDPQRLQRALEVHRISGKTLTDHWKAPIDPSPYEFKNLVINPKDRSVLHERIAKRFKQMLEVGFLDEVRHLKNIPDLTIEHPSMRSVGYRQAWQYLEGEFDHDTFVEKGIAATRQLAKRQLTWLRSMDNTQVFEDSSALKCYFDRT